MCSSGVQTGKIVSQAGKEFIFVPFEYVFSYTLSLSVLFCIVVMSQISFAMSWFFPCIHDIVRNLFPCVLFPHLFNRISGEHEQPVPTTSTRRRSDSDDSAQSEELPPVRGVTTTAVSVAAAAKVTPTRPTASTPLQGSAFFFRFVCC